MATAALPSSWSMASLHAALPSASPPQTSSSLPFTTPSFFPPSARPFCAGCKSSKSFVRSFSGLAPVYPLLSFSGDDCSSFEHAFGGINNGSKLYAIRHGKHVKAQQTPHQQRDLLRGLITQILKHGRVKTTRARASAMRKYVDKMITLAKDGSLHKRRQTLGFIYEKQIVHALLS